MIKIFLLAIAVWLVITVLKRYLKNLEASSASANSRGPEESMPEDMVQCTHCGLHLPASDSIAVGSEHYCSEAHRDAAHSATPNP